MVDINKMREKTVVVIFFEIMIIQFYEKILYNFNFMQCCLSVFQANSPDSILSKIHTQPTNYIKIVHKNWPTGRTSLGCIKQNPNVNWL